MKILLIGNSYTLYNSLDVILKSMLLDAGIESDISVVAEGGMSLQWHFHEKATHEQLESRDWDFVVLQDQSMVPIDSPIELVNSVRRFSSVLNGRNTKLCLFSTWSRKFLPGIQDDIDQAYKSAADENQAILIPVGKAWLNARNNSDIELYSPDESHPSWLGSYLTACVIFSKLTGISPRLCAYKFEVAPGVNVSIDKPVSDLLKAFAEDAIQEAI